MIEKEGMKMSLLWTLIVGGVIGWFAGLLIGRDIPGGIIGNIIAGIVGSWLGTSLLGSWGPEIAEFALIPAILGSIILIAVVSAVLRGMRK